MYFLPITGFFYGNFLFDNRLIVTRMSANDSRPLIFRGDDLPYSLGLKNRLDLDNVGAQILHLPFTERNQKKC